MSRWNSYNCWKVKFAEGEELTQPLTIYSEPEEQKKKRSVSSSPEAQPPSSALQEASESPTRSYLATSETEVSD